MSENIEKNDEEVKVETEKVEKRTVRDALYGNINLSVKTVDKFITILMVLLLVSIILALV